MSSSDPLVTSVRVIAHTASARSTWVMVQVVAKELAGVGELSDGGPAGVLVAAARSLEALAVGRPVSTARVAVRDVLEHRRETSGVADAFFWSTVLGGYESAFADLSARVQGSPLSTALGLGPPAPVRAYANLNRRWGTHSADVLCEQAALAAHSGYAAVKIAPFSWASSHGATGEDVVPIGLDLAATVRDALPPDTLLMLDCHHLVPAHLIDVAATEMAALQPFWVEDLVDFTDGVTVHRSSVSELPLAAGEHVWDPAVAARACASGALSYWLVDPKHAGGPAGTRRVVDAVKGIEGVAVTFHNPSGPVGTAHAAHLAGLAGESTWLEIGWGENDRTTLLEPPERVVDGAVVLSTSPGIGNDVAAGAPGRDEFAVQEMSVLTGPIEPAPRSAGELS